MNACAFCGRKQTIGVEGTYAGPVKAWVCSIACAGKYEARAAAAPVEHDAINPRHYKAHPSGVECIDVIEHMTLNVGSAVKYLWRAGLKTSDPVEDLRKAAWYINREIERLTRDRECPRGGHPFGSKPAECSACAGDE